MIDEISTIIRFLINSAPTVLIIIACYHYSKKTNTIDGILMILGSLIVLFTFGFFTFYYQYIYDYEDTNGGNIIMMNWINKLSNLSGAFIFMIGFVIALNKYLRLEKES